MKHLSHSLMAERHMLTVKACYQNSVFQSQIQLSKVSPVLTKLTTIGGTKHTLVIIHSGVQKTVTRNGMLYITEVSSAASVSVALLEHSLLGLIALALAGVATELSQRVRLGTDQQCLLRCLHVLGAPLPCLQHRVLESPGV